MSNQVYITRLSKFLPNNAIKNEDIEDYLGYINDAPSKAKGIILKSNCITSRYYSIDKNGNSTHTNAEMTANAVKKLFTTQGELKKLQLLSCGTTSPDQMLPSHASMVHGLLGGNDMEICSFSGACCSGIQALKFAYLSVLSGSTSNAVCTGSERLSPLMRNSTFESETENLSELDSNPYIAFEKDFLRWMLSDGAAAALIQNCPGDGLSLKIEWIELASFANKLDACMYSGGEKLANGQIKGYLEFTPAQWLTQSIFSLKQDVKSLRENIISQGVIFLRKIMEKYHFSPDSVTYFLPHLSSEFFRSKIMEELKNMSINLPYERWFTNLTYLGNVGSASAFFMLEELLNSGKLKKGHTLLLMVPESARFSYAFSLLTVC